MAERKHSDIDQNVAGLMQKENYADNKQQMIDAGDHMLRTEIHKGGDRWTGQALNELRIAGGDIMAESQR